MNTLTGSLTKYPPSMCLFNNFWSVCDRRNRIAGRGAKHGAILAGKQLYMIVYSDLMCMGDV